MPSSSPDRVTAGAKSAAISNHVVHVVSEYTGRGPTKAKTFLSDDCVVVVLEDTLTKGELSLVRDGEADRVLDTRRAYQGTMSLELTSGVEAILGRRVIAFMSDNHIDPDMAVEIFVLGPDTPDDEIDGGPEAGAATL